MNLNPQRGLSLSEVSFRYRRSSDELFNGLTHHFCPAAITAITGPSGRGKSTLLYLLGLLLSPLRGTVVLDGQPLSGLADRHRSRLRAQRFGFVFQAAELDPTRTVRDSVLEPARYAGLDWTTSSSRAHELLTRLGLADRANHRPGEISGGQAQRIAVCRALVNQPDVVLADEPTGNLDHDNAAAVLGLLQEAAHDRGHTVLIASHDQFVVEQADEVLRL